MSARKILHKFSASLSDLLSIQRKNETTDDGGTALHIATKTGNIAMVNALLEGRLVSVDECDLLGRTALHHAVVQNGTKILSLLLAHNADPNSLDYTLTSPSHLACQEGMIDAINLLLYYKADIYLTDGRDKSPFERACEYGRSKMVDRLLDLPFSFDQNSTALHLAARNGHVEICARLLQYGWPIDHKNSQGTALCEAVLNGQLQVVRYLLFMGINPHITNSSGRTALDLARRSSVLNPIIFNEIHFLLKEHEKFTHARAVKQFNGVEVNDLSFSIGDYIWVVERDFQRSRWKGVIFGKGARSRSGYFASSAVEAVDSNSAVMATMRNFDPLHSTMVSMRSSALRNADSNTKQRQIKKVAVPVVPNEMNFDLSDVLKKTDRIRDQPNGSCKTYDSYRIKTINEPNRSFLYKNIMNNGNNVQQTSSLSSSKSSERLVFCEEQNSEMSFNLNNRSSTASSSSHASSSGFESMKSDCSHNIIGKKSNYRNSSFQTPCSLPFQNFNIQSTSIRDDSPQSRSSLQSTYSVGGLSIPSNSSDDIRHSNLNVCSDALPVDIYDLVHKGHPEAEILALWLDKLGLSDYLRLFLIQGYDLSTIARITPEDLLALGVTQPNHRKILISEIHKWRVVDPWPISLPSNSLREWLSLISLTEYIDLFESQGYFRISDILNLTWEDFEDIGVKKLGHLKRLGLAIKKLKMQPTSISEQHIYKIPPPPAPKCSSLSSSKQNYSSWNACSDPMSVDSNLGMQLQLQKPMIQVHPHHRSPCTEERIDEFSELKNDSNCMNEQPMMSTATTGRLNLYSSSQILSLQPHNNLASYKYKFETEVPRSVSNSYSNEMNISSDFEGYPPPPAPLACEGSIRLLRSAFHQKTNFDRNDIHLSNQHDSSASSSFEQIPFANDNCGTIKSRDTTYFMDSPNPNTTISLPNTPRRITHQLYYGENRNANLMNCVEEVRNTTREDLTNVGSMLENLTEELDALLVREK